MPILDNISCTINTDFGPIQEFPCIKNNPAIPTSTVYIPTSTVYIPVHDGQTFSINFNVLVPSQHLSTCSLCFVPSIDGVQEPGILCSLGNKYSTISGTTAKNSHGVWELQKFVFSSIHFTEDCHADVLALGKVNKLGEIVVTVMRYQTQGKQHFEEGVRGDFLEGPSVVYEKSVKGKDISHSVSRTKGTPTQAPYSAIGKFLDTQKSPYMVFRFLYKSERALKSMGLLKDNYSPPPNLQIEHNASPTKPKAGIKHERQRLKQERAGSRPSAIPGRNMAPKVEDIETIDLTGDD